MSRLSINLLGYNSRQTLEMVIDSVLLQTYKDFELIVTDNGSSDGSAEFVRDKYPNLRLIANQTNFGYAGGHNTFFRSAQTELVMVLNPDVVLDKFFLEEVLKVFEDDRVAAVTGKMIKNKNVEGKSILDGTGIVLSHMRRGRERGQWEEDLGQYDNKTDVFGVSGTAAIYRLAALQQVAVLKESGTSEYFDEDFFAYWEDLDLSWRLRLFGYKCKFVPRAIANHTRRASSSPGGYMKFFSFVSHHRNLPEKIKRWNWKNHLFCIVKNDFGMYFWRDAPLIFLREFAMLIFIFIFEIRTLGVIPEFFSQLPKMLAKRKWIMQNKTVNSPTTSNWFKWI